MSAREERGGDRPGRSRVQVLQQFSTSSPEADLPKTMGRMWTRLASTGDPNGPGLPNWPLYEPARDPYIVFATPPKTGQMLHSANCDFWDSALPPP